MTSVFPRANPFGPIQSVISDNINAVASGDNIIVAGTPNRRILVFLYLLVANAPVTVDFASEDGTILSGPYGINLNGGNIGPFAQYGHFLTNPGEDLILNLSSAVQVGGHILYGLI
jgi:hypothetical protein